MLALTQQDVADAVGIRFQQIQKYETGANRVSASRLYDIAQALGSPVLFFFQEMDAETEASVRPVAEGSEGVPDVLSEKEALDFLRYYYRLDENSRRRLFELTRSLCPPV